MRHSVASLALLILLAAPAAAGELEGVQMPDETSIDGKTLQLNGVGLREKFVFDVYVAGLYLETPTSDAKSVIESDQANQLVMHFVYKKVAAGKLADAWTEGLKANRPDRFSALKPQLEQLNGWMEDVVRGDEMRFTSRPGAGLEVSVKGSVKGLIDNDEFTGAFWSIFVGDKPPAGALKSGLLGGS